ncbi:uncharacterized protein LOC104433540 isoform X2 [Eucalyptus grandis]|uniref:uncharacterized protein LOC104433540 isoform X2 n=1 Tax=Eucalyptus grandis TaxID=71139 RepID=UPI00192E9F3A|nr:uncharacterized protein LOC104433540 isoform X2 [Eucalyptus grandis]
MTTPTSDPLTTISSTFRIADEKSGSILLLIWVCSYFDLLKRRMQQLAIRLLPPSDTTTPTIASARFPASSHVFPLLVGSKVWVVAVSSAQIPASRSLPRELIDQRN